MDGTPTLVAGNLIGFRLERLQQATRLPVVFGGPTASRRGSSVLRLTQLRGTISDALHGLDVQAGRGMGGAAMVTREPCLVADYARTSLITHDYDDQVVAQERMVSLVAFPVHARGRVRGVVYGGVRGTDRIGERSVLLMSTFVGELERELEAAFSPPAPDSAETAMRELAALARDTADPVLAAQLTRIVDRLGVAPAAATTVRPPVRADRSGEGMRLAPREREVLVLVAQGMTNAQAAESLGLSTETVRAYMRSAMHRMGVTSRAAAVHRAGRSGLL